MKLAAGSTDSKVVGSTAAQYVAKWAMKMSSQQELKYEV